VTPTGTVTTTERYSIDPKVIADANRAQLVTITRRFIRVNHDRVKAWLAEGSLGAAFYTAVRYFDRDLTAFDGDLDGLGDSVIRARITRLNEEGQQLQGIYDSDLRQYESFLDGSIVVSKILKETSSVLISALGSPLQSALYQAVVSLIGSFVGDEKDSLQLGIVKAAAAAVFESWAPLKQGGAGTMKEFLRATFNQAFQNVGAAISDYLFAIKGKELTVKQKRALREQLAVRIAVSVGGSPLGGAVAGNQKVLQQLEVAIGSLISELLDKVVELTLGAD
jgi:hypothetical protein